MKNKDKKIKELELENIRLFWFGIFAMIFFFILIVIVTISLDNQNDGLEQELQSCQEKVLVSTLKIECNYLSPVGYPYSFTYEYSKIDSIKKEELKDFYLKDSRCEVIK